MAWRSDVAGFLKGFESITRALVEHQGREWQQTWSNSSIRTAVQQSQLSAPDPQQMQVVSKAHNLHQLINFVNTFWMNSQYTQNRGAALNIDFRAFPE